MEQEYLVRKIIAGIFLKRYKLGNTEISLKMDDIIEYAPKLADFFDEENLKSDLFIKTPVSETYDEFKSFLISYMLGMKLGYMNNEYNKIILTTNEYFIDKYLKNMSEYETFINKGYNILTTEEEKGTVKKIGSI